VTGAAGLTKPWGQLGYKSPRVAEQALTAQAEDVKVMGTVWLLSMLVKNQLLSVEDGLDALTLMRESKRRLPWADAERILNGLRSEH
jgi:hypothetical protein